MVFYREILHRFRWHLWRLAALTGGGILLLVITHTQLQQARETHSEASASLASMRSRLIALHAETRQLGNDIARYRELAARGYVGTERRTEWAALIERISADLKLLGIEYELAPQRTLTTGGDSPHRGDAIAVQASTMRLQMLLLHEGDLLDFLDELRRRAPAYIHIRSCALSRLDPAQHQGDGSAQLAAECSLDWITLREATGGQS